MKRKIVRLRSGDEVPENAKHLYSAEEDDYENKFRKTTLHDGLFTTREYTDWIIPKTVFHYYEVRL